MRDPGPMGMGPVCLKAATGAKPRRLPREDRRSDDVRQMELGLGV